MPKLGVQKLVDRIRARASVYEAFSHDHALHL